MICAANKLKAFVMPLDHGSWFDQDHGVEDLRPDPVEPHPEQPVGGEEHRTAGVLAPQDRHLMPKSGEFKFQRGTATKPEREQGEEGGQNRDHGDDGRAVVRYSLGFLGILVFEQGQGPRRSRLAESHLL